MVGYVTVLQHSLSAGPWDVPVLHHSPKYTPLKPVVRPGDPIAQGLVWEIT